MKKDSNINSVKNNYIILYLNFIFFLISLSNNLTIVFAQENNFNSKSKTKIGDPTLLRDPFKRPYLTKEQSFEVKDLTSGILKNGVYTNILTIDDIPIDNIIIIGVLFGKERRAIATTNESSETFIIKEGMLLGVDKKAEVKAILPGGVVIVESIKNFKGDDEYLETILPLTSLNSSGNVTVLGKGGNGGEGGSKEERSSSKTESSVANPVGLSKKLGIDNI